MKACERAIAEAQFRSIELVATLAGEPLYAAFSLGRSDVTKSPNVGSVHSTAIASTIAVGIRLDRPGTRGASRRVDTPGC